MYLFGYIKEDMSDYFWNKFWVSKMLNYTKIKMQYMINYIITIDIIFMALKDDNR